MIKPMKINQYGHSYIGSFCHFIGYSELNIFTISNQNVTFYREKRRKDRVRGQRKSTDESVIIIINLSF